MEDEQSTMTSRTLQIIGRVSPALCSTPVRTPPAEGGAAGHPSKPAAKEGASNDRRGKGPETSKRKRGASRRQGRSKYDRSDPSHSTMRAPRIAGKEKGKRKKDPFKRRGRQQIKLNWSISKASCQAAPSGEKGKPRIRGLCNIAVWTLPAEAAPRRASFRR